MEQNEGPRVAVLLSGHPPAASVLSFRVTVFSSNLNAVTGAFLDVSVPGFGDWFNLSGQAKYNDLAHKKKHEVLSRTPSVLWVFPAVLEERLLLSDPTADWLLTSSR